ncbi:restriction endonuclease subunit S [Vibrio parahaemolyticus]|nr:restriction endonuclease subunit S [Vibrio parahaemolyticus]ELA6599036.1 restriction endonuclease subunit S [Vibrio alginolyticus]ELA6602525.1 restriction endonuclease subunit S [Vibrio alginolyticus]
MFSKSIPTGWKLMSVGEFTSEHKQGFYTKQSYSDEGVLLARITDLSNPRVNFNSMPKLQISEKDYQAFKVCEGDFLFARSGAIGRYGIVDKTPPKTIFASYLIRFKFNELVNSYYIGQVYESELTQAQIKAISQGNANININAENIKKLKMLVPPLLEQQKIAEVLSTVDKKIDLIDQKIAETEKLKTGLMQKLFSEGVGVQGENGEWQPHTEFQYDSLLGKKPKSWQTETLGNILDIASSKRIKREEYVNEGVPFYRSKEIILKSKQLSFTPEIFISRERFDKLSEKFGSPQQGDILISAVGTIGAIYRVRDEEFYFKDGNLLWIRNIDKSGLSSEFLECYFRSYLCQEMLANLSAGSSQNALTIVKLSKLPLIIPTKDEQKMIVSIISSINEKIYLLKAQKSETQQLKKGLMQKLLTGEWRVPLEETEAA